MTDPPEPLEPSYEDSWDESLAELGLTGQAFDTLWSACEDFLRHHPFDYYSMPVPEGQGFRMFATERAFPDIPPLYVYYRVEGKYVVFSGLSPAWSRVQMSSNDN